MTPAEVAFLLDTVEKRWPHAPLPLGSADVWLEDLRDLPATECQAAVTRWAKAGERFPPTSGWVCSEVERRSQDAPPSFNEVGDIVARGLGRAASRELYRPNGHWSVEDTVRAVEILALAGVHEAVLRYVQEVGVGEVLTTPHGDMHALDPGQSADRRDLSRHFERVSVPGWQANPSSGLALANARRALGRGDGGLRPVGELGRGA
jgi:hypothetical protein